MWHLSGVPVVEAAAWLGHSPTEHLKTYAHATLSDRSEIGYNKLGSGGTPAALKDASRLVSASRNFAS